MKKKKIFGTKQVITALLLAALGGAVWLNMQFGATSGGFVTANSSNKNLGDTKYVGTVSDTPAMETAATTDYFKTAAAERKAAREEALNLLEETIESLDSDKEAKSAASEKMAVIAERMEKEAAIETLIKAKGFEKVITIIGDKDVTVIVSAEALLPSQTLQIQDAVTSQTEISLQNIKIVSKK